MTRVAGSRLGSWLRDSVERVRRVPWPADAPSSSSGDRVAIVVVNYQTRLLVSHLIFSLYRILGPDQFANLVVVDNASTDGSCETLAALHDAGLLQLLDNRTQRYHGPALNQAISWLARRQANVTAAERVDYVWVLDSDVIVMRRDVLADAVPVMRETGAALGGQKVPGTTAELVPISCLLMNPRLSWQRGLPPFFNNGAPSNAMQEAVIERRLGIASFPFGLGSYALHLGSGTLNEIASRDEHGNRFYDWAVQRREFTYSRHPLGRRLHEAFLTLYDSEVPDDSPQALVDALQRPTLLTLPEARPLPPVEEMADLMARGVDVAEHLVRRFQAGDASSP